MTPELFKVLKKIYEKGYTDEKFQYDWDRGGVRIYDTSELSAKELSALQGNEWQVNNIGHFTHAETINRLIVLGQHERLELKDVLNAFIAGVNSYPRGRQTIMSYLFAKRQIIHNHKESGAHCEHCSARKETWINVGENIFSLYNGYAWNEFIEDMLIDLDAFVTEDIIIPTEEDVVIFKI